jgi:hypothetical protein
VFRGIRLGRPNTDTDGGSDDLTTLTIVRHVKWVPCHHGMARPQVADGGGGLQIWRVDANILIKQSLTADKGWPSSLGIGRGANNFPP